LENCLLDGNTLKSIPYQHPIETEIAELYEKIGRTKFEEMAKEYFQLQKVLRDAKAIDPAPVSGL